MARVWSLSGAPRAFCWFIRASPRVRGMATPFTVASAAAPFAAPLVAGSLLGSACAETSMGAANRAAARIRIVIAFLSLLRECSP
jgi:hypothetical protein